MPAPITRSRIRTVASRQLSEVGPDRLQHWLDIRKLLIEKRLLNDRGKMREQADRTNQPAKTDFLPTIPLLLVLEHPPMWRVIAILVGCLAVVSVATAQDAPTLPTVTSFECPKYPPKAKSVRLQGMVRLKVTTDGHNVTEVKLQSGHPLIAPAAYENVRTWKFADHPPTTFDVTYFYVFQGEFKKDPTTKCSAKMELPTKITVSTTMP
ncbi:MAG: energy transducer TonB [Terriglobales bacterium]